MDCARCHEAPPPAAYQCRHCGKVEDVVPYPNTGCRCIARAYVCSSCLDKRVP